MSNVSHFALHLVDMGLNSLTGIILVAKLAKFSGHLEDTVAYSDTTEITTETGRKRLRASGC
jgi:hypothetical protein